MIILTNDHCAIEIPSTSRSSPSKYITIQKRTVTPTAKVAISQELSSHNWSSFYEEKSIDAKVDILQNSLSRLFDKHCPVKTARVPFGKPPLTSPLLKKLRRAKKREWSKHKRSEKWKSLNRLVINEQQKLQLKHTNDSINNMMKGSSNWWKEVIKLTGDTTQSQRPSLIHLEDHWMTLEQFISNLNDYYLEAHENAELNFPEIPTSNKILWTNVIQIYNLLSNINTKKATTTLAG